MLKGKVYTVTCEALGVPGTNQASYRAANTWWEAKVAEIAHSKKVHDQPSEVLLQNVEARQVAAIEVPRQPRCDCPEGGAVGHVVVGDPVDRRRLGRDRDAGVRPPGPVIVLVAGDQLHFEPRYAPGFEPLLKEFPRTTVIIDHLGRPFQGSPEENAVVHGWAKLPNTVMKLSSLPEKGQYPHRDVGPVIRDLVGRFGPDRLIYGGGFGPGATGASYRAYREKVCSYLTDLSAGDQAKVLGGTAARLFGFVKA
jgi:Amidohydrolase